MASDHIDQESIFFNIRSEYGKLKTVLVHGGATVVPLEEVGRIESKYGGNYEKRELEHHTEVRDWDVFLLQEQLKNLHQTLRAYGVNLIFASDVPDAWLQFFTRDVGFVVGNTFYFSVLRLNIRKLEKRGIDTSRFSQWAELTVPNIEGGDIFVHGARVFIGISRQTTTAALRELCKYIEPEGFQCIPVECGERVLHLDCRFNIISAERAVISRYGMNPSGVKTLEKHLELVEITDQELKTLATNYFLLSPTQALVDERNERVASILQDAGYGITTIDFTEPTKMWGGLRCTMCPLERS